VTTLDSAEACGVWTANLTQGQPTTVVLTIVVGLYVFSLLHIKHITIYYNIKFA